HIDLVVVGTNGRNGLGRLFIGSVAEQVFRNSSCPVLSVGPHSAANYEPEPARSNRPLLFATDFGGASLETLPHVISLAKQLGRKLILLHVLRSVPELGNRCFTAFDAKEVQDRAKKATVQKFAKLVAQEAPLKDGLAFMVEFDEPAQGILTAAEVLHAEMIILGLAHKTYFETFSHLPWTTAYEVVCGSECPVLTLR